MQDSRFTIDRLSLGNYHRFECFDIELDDCLTVVIGDNGAGKTAFLDALAVAAGSIFAKIEDADDDEVREDRQRQGVVYRAYRCPVWHRRNMQPHRELGLR